MEVQFFYRLGTLQIDAAYFGCQTSSAVFKDTTVYTEVNVENPQYTVSRDHKVILDAEGAVIDTTPNINPVQPTPARNPNQDLINELRDIWPTLTAEQKIALVRKVLQRLLGA